LIEPDPAAARAKYADRKRIPLKDLPRSELETEKAKKPAAAGKSKKNKSFASFEEDDKKPLFAPEGW
jgi:hypothetical protein